MDPSVSSGLVELDPADWTFVAKVTNKRQQRVVIVQTDGDGHETRQTYNLSGLTLDDSVG